MKTNYIKRNLPKKCISYYLLFCEILLKFNFSKSFSEKVGKIQFSFVLLSERQNKFFSQIKKYARR